MPVKEERVIVCLVASQTVIYPLGREPIGHPWAVREGFEVKSIKAYRDGVTGLFKEDSDGSHYIVTLVSNLSDKVKMYDVIPSREITQLSYTMEAKPPSIDEQIELTTEE